MNVHIQYFKNHNLTIVSEDGLNLKIKGLSFLPGGVKDSVLEYAKAHKKEIILELAGLKISKMSKCLHGLPCRFIFVKDYRQMCSRNQQPIFDLDACPIGKCSRQNTQEHYEN